MELIKQNKKEFTTLLKNTGVNIDKFMLSAISLSKDTLKDCTQESIVKQLIRCASIGLDPNPSLQEFFLIPKKNSAKNNTESIGIIGYKGLIKLAYESGFEVIGYGAIKENDIFEELSLDQTPKFVKARMNRGKLIGSFCVVKNIQTGSISYSVLWEDEIIKSRDYSVSYKSQNNKYSPWMTDPDSMYIKTAIRYHVSRLPLNYKSKIAIEEDMKGEIDITPEKTDSIDQNIIDNLQYKLSVLKESEFLDEEIESLYNEFVNNKIDMNEPTYNEGLKLIDQLRVI